MKEDNEELFTTGYEPLEEMLERFRNKESDNEDSYERTLYISNPENPYEDIEYDFDEELEKAMKKVGITNWTMQECGGFDSPGYDISCYCLAYIDLNGELITIPIVFEIF